jgi:hypothetical protein
MKSVTPPALTQMWVDRTRGYILPLSVGAETLGIPMPIS